MSGLRLYGYFRSGAAHRVRIALALKAIAYETIPVHLLRGGGEHLLPGFRLLNPQARLPVLQLADGTALVQSAAILEYLEEIAPSPALLPADPVLRAKIRGVAAIIGSDIHPLNNVSVLNTLRAAGLDADARSAWIAQWIMRGLAAVEALIGEASWCFGTTPTLADVYLAPQIFSAHRFKVPLDDFPRITHASALAAAHPAFGAAAPENQPDAE
jgi:maleylacetoacetate isomerase